MIARWVGIDEAGYGPNLGPLVMTAVVAEGTQRPDLWRDCASSVARAGCPSGRLWVDDSKRLFQPGHGLDRLQAATDALLRAIGAGASQDLAHLLNAVAAGSLEDVELLPWIGPATVPLDPPPRPLGPLGPFDGGPWRIRAACSEVVGPARFNRDLARTGSKARVHFEAFVRLLRRVWEPNATALACHVTSDKHGGRHYYYGPLVEAFPDCWIDRGAEGPERSHYAVRAGERTLSIDLRPRADSDDGLVALASIVSKTIRELWMAVFNAYWQDRVPGLRPTAGYPRDAARFRAEIASACDLPPDLWWRRK